LRVTQPPSPSARDMDSAISGSPALVVPILPLADFLQPVGGPIRAQQMQLVADAIPRHWRLRSRTRLMFGRTRVRPPQATPAAPPRGLNAAPAGLSRPCGSLKLMTGAQRQVHETFTSFLSCPPQVYPARGDVLAGDTLSAELAQHMPMFVAFLPRRIGITCTDACTPALGSWLCRVRDRLSKKSRMSFRAAGSRSIASTTSSKKCRPTSSPRPRLRVCLISSQHRFISRKSRARRSSLRLLSSSIMPER